MFKLVLFNIAVKVLEAFVLVNFMIANKILKII